MALEEVGSVAKKRSTLTLRKEDIESDSDRRSIAASTGRATKSIAINSNYLERRLNDFVPESVVASVIECPVCDGTGGDLEHAQKCAECDGAGSKKDEFMIEVCTKCDGRGFALPEDDRCKVCNAYKLVMNIPANVAAVELTPGVLEAKYSSLGKAPPLILTERVEAGYALAIQIVHETTADITITRHRQIPFAAASAWLKKPLHTEEGQVVGASLKLLVVEPNTSSKSTSDKNKPAKKPFFNEEFLSECGVEVPVPNMPFWPYTGETPNFQSRAPFYHNGYDSDAAQRTRLCVRVEKAWLATTHDFETMATRGVYYDDDNCLADSREDFSNCFQHMQRYLYHPLGPYLMLARLGSFHARSQGFEISETISTITDEIKMGPHHKLQDTGKDAEWLSKLGNIADSLRALSQLALAQNNLLLMVMKLLTQLKRYSKHYDAIVASRKVSPINMPLRAQSEVCKQIAEVAYCMDIMDDELSERLVYNDYARDDAGLLLTTLNRMATTQDARVSIQIARDGKTLAIESKRDSTSMKTIAAVTMVFLPGTFVASMFAMPMFNWTVPAGRSVSPSFWIYWAVTLPLTVLVILGWIGWFQYKQMKERTEDRAAQLGLLTRKSEDASDYDYWTPRRLGRREKVKDMLWDFKYDVKDKLRGLRRRKVDDRERNVDFDVDQFTVRMEDGSGWRERRGPVSESNVTRQ